ncbi:MAG: polysaccharide biosynthesis protein [Clostridiaceae bacterium]|nr:polysaccharide biosynthesis protein [Clostridiaceae bacterium]
MNQTVTRKKQSWRKWKQRLFIMAIDVVVLNVSFLLALLVRFDFKWSLIPGRVFDNWLIFASIFTVSSILIYLAFRLYSFVWRYVSSYELMRIFIAVFLSTVLNTGLSLLFDYRLPLSVYFLGAAFTLILTVGMRLMPRIILIRMSRGEHHTKNGLRRERVLIYGAANTGRLLVNEYAGSSHLNATVVCLIDDNPGVQGKLINGVPIVGGRERLHWAVEHYRVDTIILAMTTLTPKQQAEILELCKTTSCKLRKVAGMYQMLTGRVTISDVTDVTIDDLLGREPVKIDIDGVAQYIAGKVVLVTGGGGSIGSELCRQVARHNPRLLIIFDIYENSIYEIQMELEHVHPELNLLTLIGSVRDLPRIENLFATYRPEIVFHAAAHKHVPLMEASPVEAIKNNVFGTLNLCLCADRYKVRKFVQVSTDKAVNPTNVMGASKRLCEMIIQSINPHSQTDFVAVRFGNVLDSNGSVVPLFRKQIAAGGPVTVTHPEVIRFFMTIPEAVSLILQAGAYAHGGEIFVLDMGDPVKILDLARNMILLSGLQPDVDIDIEFIGLRPGEKLYEELLMDSEGMRRTENKKIFIAKPHSLDWNDLTRDLDELHDLCLSEEDDRVVQKVTEMVPTFNHLVN